MAVAIRDAPAPGWYLPAGETMAKRVPFLWTGIAKMVGSGLQGHLVSINKHDTGPQIQALWKPSAFIVETLGSSGDYQLVPTLPDEWRGQDIRAATKKAEEAADRIRGQSRT